MTDEKTDIPVEVEAEATAPAQAPDAPTELQAAQHALTEQARRLELEKKELHDRLLRTAADFDNFRKRSRKDADEARFKAREEVLKELLPVLDNLERSLAAGSEGQGIVDGVKLVLRQAESAMEKFDVKRFTAVGQPFDPARHEAIVQVGSSDLPPGTVVSEMQKGYTIGNRLLRPALVAVSRAEAAPGPPAEAAEPDSATSTESPDPGEPPPGERTDPGTPPTESR